MNVYAQFGLAMCLIVFLSLAGTAYLAARFNRGAKRDLAAALAPLAEVVGGDIDLEAASVTGRYAGHLVEARVSANPDGPGRAFVTDLVDPAGGQPWRVVSWPTRDPDSPPDRTFASPNSALERQVAADWEALVRPAVDPDRERYRLEYDPAAGAIRFARPMKTRRDIPDADRFRRELDLLVGLGPRNRLAQGAPDADFVGARRAVRSDGAASDEPVGERAGGERV